MSLPNRYDRGALVRAKATFTDSDGNLVDPAVVHFRFQPPKSAVTTWTFGTDGGLVRDSLGKYHADIDTTSHAGIWYYGFDAPPGSAGQAAAEGQFTVSESRLQ